MRRLISELEKAEAFLKDINRDYIFELCASYEQFVQLKAKYETNPKQIGILFKLYEE